MSQQTEIEDTPVSLWCRKLKSSSTVIFARTVSDVTVVAGDRLTSAKDLSEVIGHDVSLATRLIRIASSALFNRHGRTVDTINTAIVRIGFDAIKELAVTLAIVEKVLSGSPHERVTQAMSRAFHAAAQAKALGKCCDANRLEEVFAAALLFELGAMLFWSNCGEQGDQITALLAGGVPEQEAQRRILGFTENELTAELAKQWHLGRLLQQAVEPGTPKDSRVSLVKLGHEIASTVEQWGWDSAQTQQLVRQIAGDFEMKVAAVEELIEENYRHAIEIANRYGVTLLENAQTQTTLPETQPSRSESQLQILQELGSALSEGRSLNELVALVLRGVKDGLGFDRTYFALLAPDRKQLECRYGLGSNPPNFLQASRPFSEADDVFVELLREGKARQLSPRSMATRPEYVDWLAYSTCVLMPIIVQDKPVGVLYADNAASQAEVDDEAFRGFQLFGQQLVSVVRLVREGARKSA